ncbi:MAG: MerR family DNA-binding transcriptional regulator [Burkholderiales bacterium]|nr:MerR family DNA-binding transcriptional regulator [Burkholderiales bacterium]
MPAVPTKPVAETGDEPTYTISDLAREFALTTRAIRFYEEEGMLAPERRGRSRVYRDRERARLGLILRGKRLGFSLSEIRELLDQYAVRRNERAQFATFIESLEQRRARLLQQKDDIDAVLAEIDTVAREYRRRLKDEARPGRSALREPAPTDPAAPAVQGN